MVDPLPLIPDTEKIDVSAQAKWQGLSQQGDHVLAWVQENDRYILGLGAAVSVWEREQGRFKGSIKGASREHQAPNSWPFSAPGPPMRMACIVYRRLADHCQHWVFFTKISSRLSEF